NQNTRSFKLPLKIKVLRTVNKCITSKKMNRIVEVLIRSLHNRFALSIVTELPVGGKHLAELYERVHERMGKMVKWKEQMVIEAPIEQVWELFQDEKIERIMPKVESHDLLEGEPNATGAKHAQVYTEGKQQQRYIVETLSYVDEPDRKYRETAFEMGQMFKVR